MPLSPSSMASIPQFYSNYTFPTDFTEFNTSGIAAANDNVSIIENTMWNHDHNFIPVLDSGALDHIASLDCDTVSSAWLPTFSEHLGSVSTDLAVPANSDCKLSFFGGGAVAGFQNFSTGYQPHIGEFGDECCGFVEDVKAPPYPNSARENWGVQGNQIAAVEEPNIKVGRYSEEERKERILRYLKKRNQRNFNKTIKYACRKTLADRRVRVRGRFARNNELCEEETGMKKNENLHKEDLDCGDSIHYQLRNNDEDWLQEAMASLVYLSHSSPDDDM
ncbi:hypothetical protein L6164_022815 [Bauhinia variegata]|uniref:Uncharacterized protein n=1 Tax=Bauhinia variegata TaxID=167791 RepID=A0ACB9MG90_BAUVA|nr:hypothetical protein L6164_022815 [Bauhinia variegata]